MIENLIQNRDGRTKDKAHGVPETTAYTQVREDFWGVQRSHWDAQ